MPQVSLSTFTSFDGALNALVEDQGTSLTVRFDLDEPAPEGGLKVYIDSEIEQIFNRLDLPGAIANPQVENLNLLATQTNFDNSGLAVEITEGSTFATVTLNVFDNPEPDTFLPETFDGLVEASFFVRTASEVSPEDAAAITGLSDYTVDPNAGESVVLFADDVSQLPTPDPDPEPDPDPDPDPTPSPVTSEGESSNDTIATATPSGITADNPKVTFNDEIFGNFFDPDLSLRTDISEDVDIYAVDLDAGDFLQIDIDASQIGSGLDSILQVFDAQGNALAKSDDNFAPEELFNADVDVDSYIEFTAETAGTYYVGVSSFANSPFDDFDTDFYDPNIVGSGSGNTIGEYQINLALNQPISFNGEPTVVPSPDGTGPVVSFTATPLTVTTDAAFLANALVQPVLDGEESPETSTLTFQFSTEGEFPEDGVEIFLNTNAALTELIDVRGFIEGSGVTIVGAIFDESGVPTGLRLNLTATVASFTLNLDNAEIIPTDGTQNLEVTLIPSAGYQADGMNFSTPIYDSLSDVPDVATSPTVSLSAINTELIESEGNTTTLTISLSEPPPAEGVLVFVDSGTEDAVREFNVFDAVIIGAETPFVDDDASGFYLPMTEQTATITVSAYDETVNPNLTLEDTLEGIETLTFNIAGGPGYNISPEANSIDITIADNPDSVVLPDDGGNNGGNDGGTDDDNDNPENELNDTIATATDTGLNTDNPAYTTTATLDVQEVFSPLYLSGFTDITEDVDMYAFSLEAGQTITLNVEASDTTNEAGEVEVSLLAPVLRLFDDAGTEVAIFENAVTEATVPQATNNASVEFTASDAGTYYAGVSVLGNTFYDPNVEGSGSGWFFEDQFEPGNYELTASLENVNFITPVADEFEDSYSTRSLGRVPLDTGGFVPAGYGGIAFLDDDTLLVTGNPYSPEATIYAVDVTRDAETNSITGFAGPATFFAEAPGIGSLDPDSEPEPGGLDGGLTVAPNGTILYATYGDNSIGQILPGSTAPDAFIDLTALGVEPSTGSLEIVPEGSPGEGRLKITSFDNGNFYDALLTENADGTYDVSIEGSVALDTDDLFRGVEGLDYVDESYPGFITDTVLISEYDTNNISAFEVDDLGNPIVDTERTFLDGLTGSGAGGSFDLIVDSVTGDLLVSYDSAFTADDADQGGRLLLITDETPPTAVADTDPFDNAVALDISGGSATASGTVSTSNDVYAIDATAGELLSIEINVTEALTGIAYTNDDTQLYLYNEAGDVLAFSEDKPDSFASNLFNYLVPETGTYYAAVTTAGNEPILELGQVNQLLGFEETGLANVAYDITVDAQDVPTTARLFDIALEVAPDNPIGNVLIDGDEVLFLDLNGTRNTDITGVLPIEVNAEDVNSPENTLDNTLVFEDTLSFNLDLFDFILDFDEPFASTEVGDIVDSLETSGITAIIPPDQLIQRIVFSEQFIDEQVSSDDGETLVGSNFRVSIDGQGGDDTLAGGLGDDLILGGDGDDVLRGDLNERSPQDGGNGGNDIIFGGEGSDRIGGKAGNDILSGDAGDDFIWGDDGDDILMGVTGNDILTGDNGSSGSGSDTFVFGNGDGTDTITDFEVGIDFIGLVEGELVFEDLNFTQDGDNTLLGVSDSGETLAILNDVQAAALDASSFVIVPDVSNPSEALALI